MKVLKILSISVYKFILQHKSVFGSTSFSKGQPAARPGHSYTCFLRMLSNNSICHNLRNGNTQRCVIGKITWIKDNSGMRLIHP